MDEANFLVDPRAAEADDVCGVRGDVGILQAARHARFRAQTYSRGSGRSCAPPSSPFPLFLKPENCFAQQIGNRHRFSVLILFVFYAFNYERPAHITKPGELYEEAIAGYTESLGNANSSTLNAKYNYAGLAEKQDEGAAKAIWQEVVVRHIEVYGPTHELTIDAQRRLDRCV